MRSWQSLEHHVRLQQARLEGAHRALQAVSPQDTLSRGYAIVHDPAGLVVMRAETVSPGDQLNIVLHDGNIQAEVVVEGSDHDG
jgi:exodeoxyribonuclease VII large subunit